MTSGYLEAIEVYLTTVYVLLLILALWYDQILPDNFAFRNPQTSCNGRSTFILNFLHRSV